MTASNFETALRLLRVLGSLWFDLGLGASFGLGMTSEKCLSVRFLLRWDTLDCRGRSINQLDMG